MTHFTPTAEGPINDLFLAINHYVSTGDLYGEGVALDLGGDLRLVQIPYDPKSADDAEDYRKFSVRLGEILQQHRDLAGPLKTLDRLPRFVIAGFEIDEGRMRDLARELVRHPGSAGWGTGKALIDQHFPSAREKLLSGEGL
jgi:hypothetical protein